MTVTTPRCCTVDLPATREAITAALSSAQYQGQALRVNEWLSDTFTPPCALVGVFNIEWEDDSYNGLPTALVSVRLVVPVIANRPAQQDLDLLQMAYAQALFDDITLGGTVTLCRPTRTNATTFSHGNREFPCADCETLIVF